MRIKASSSDGAGLYTIALEHLGQISTWDVSSTYARTQSRNDDEINTETLFGEINGYWATLSAERQQGIWDVYEEIRKTLDEDRRLVSATTTLRRQVAALYNYMPLSEISHYVKFYVNIDYPSSVKDTLDPEAGNDRAKRTYLQPDYFGLAVLAVALRPMIPIWGQFVEMAHNELGNNYKEYQAFGLLYSTHLMQSSELDRLREFIEDSIKTRISGDKTFTPVLSGLGTLQLPYWLLAMTCVRRLAPATVTGSGEQVNLIAKVHYYVDSKMKSLDRDFGRKFGGKVTEKKKKEAAEDNKEAVTGMYKLKPDICDGDIAVLNVYPLDSYRLATVTGADGDPEILNECLKLVKTLDQIDTAPHQMWLVKWVMHGIIPPKGVDLLTIEPFLNCLAVTQALLWQKGFYDLAAIVTSEEQISDDIVIGATESRLRIPKENLQRLQEQYPYAPPVKRNSTVRQSNIAARAIDRLAEILTKNDWVLRAPPALLGKTSRIGNSRTLSAPADVKIQLCELLETLQQKSTPAL